MAKRVKKLKDTIKELEDELVIERQRREYAESESKSLRARLRRLGRDEKLKCVESKMIPCMETEIDVELRPFGTYLITTLEAFDNIEIHEDLMKKVTESLANGLIQNNLVRFVEHRQNDGDPLSQPTIAVKAYVVPWDSIVKKQFKMSELQE